MATIPNSQYIIENFRKIIILVGELVVAIAGIALFLFYLLSPWYADETQKNLSKQKIDSLLLDCFIMRDASGSVSEQTQSIYGGIEQGVLGHLQVTNGGDRISYAYFGSDTQPTRIQPPSIDMNSIRANMAHQPHFATTDFALLFHRLRDTIADDRKAQAAVNRHAHADTIIILTDGIPDSSPGPQRCPQSNLITEDIVEAYKDLIDGPYVTQEPIYVRLIIAGAPEGCAPEIKGDWERRLGDSAARKKPTSASASSGSNFEVLSYTEFVDVEKTLRDLFEHLRRQPRIIISLSYKDSERRNLDLGKAFSIQYSAQYFCAEREVMPQASLPCKKANPVQLSHGSILDTDGNERFQLSAVSDPDRVPAEARVKIYADPPGDSQLLGEISTGLIYFKPEGEQKMKLSELEPYYLQLHFSPNDSVEILPENFALSPCQHATQRVEARKRFLHLAILPLVFVLVFLVGTLLWFATQKAGDGTPTKAKINKFIERYLVVPHRNWLGILLIFLIPLAVSLLYLESIGFSVCVGLLLSLSLFVLEKFKRSPTMILLCFTIEFMILPFLHLLITKLD